MALRRDINNEEKIKLIGFEPEITTKLIEECAGCNEEEIVAAVRKYDDCFNGCSECGNDLEWGEDGYWTSHGTCDDCVDSYKEEH